jgi:hypothetical protein
LKIISINIKNIKILPNTLLAMLLFLSFFSFAQTFPVTGKITNANGEPLAGVTVQVKGGAAKTVSKNDGTFSISAPSATSVLIFSYVGFTEQEIPINNNGQLAISMSVSTNLLQDVVVVGYGTQKKRDITGAVATFNATNLDERPITRVDQALVGQMAGVRVKQTSGRRGEAFLFRSREQDRSLRAMNHFM